IDISSLINPERVMYLRNVEYNPVTTNELHSLLFRINHFGNDVSFRFRLQGQMWMPDFMEVVNARHTETIFRNRSTGKLICVRDINEVMQFELDTAFEGYE